MFTGVGGFELGIGNKGECIGFSEIDKYANQLLSNKFPEVRNYGDATKINPSELPDFDMLCGGFPCQSFSIAGKRRGFQDTRGTMFFHIARILEVKRPKIVFLENVKGLLNHDEGKTFKVIIQTLSELGYDVQWMVLNSKFFGVPQNRERVFIIGSLRGQSRPEILPFREMCKNTNESNGQGNDTAHCLQVGDKARGSYIKGDSQGMRVYDTNGTSSTLAGNAGGLGGKTGLYITQQINRKTRDLNKAIKVGRLIANQENKPVQIDLMHLLHGEIRPLSTYIPQNEDARCVQAGEPKEILIEPSMKIRRLTPTECERLQGFPDGWTEGFSDTQRYKMMGNAVTVNVIKAIAKKL
jgi:DNA (cytosine-5)-methyltransferase 1